MPSEEAGTKVVLRDFPKGWCAEGKELLLVSLQAQLQVFGSLKGEPWISPNLSHAEVVFSSLNDAKEAVEVLHGVDFREPEELLAHPDDKYKGLHVALKSGGKRAGGGAPQGEPAKKEAKKVAKAPVVTASSPAPAAEGVAALAGTWSISYDGNSADMNYTITETGEVRVGKKRWLQLVPAGSAEDVKQDPNYAGTFLLNDAHREDTWEYMWLEGGVLRLHHFTTEDTGVSPYGSPNFFGSGEGVPADQAAAAQAAMADPFTMQPSGGSAAKKQKGNGKGGWRGFQAPFEGTWNIMYEGDTEASMTYTISASGEVTVGKKRHLQLVAAGSPQDTRRDRNYAFEGIVLLDQAHREDTWEYMWIEMGKLCIHHFTEHDKGRSVFGSRKYWGMGIGVQGNPQQIQMQMQMAMQPEMAMQGMGRMGGGGGAAWGGGGAAWGAPAPAQPASYWRQGQSGTAPAKKAAKTSWESSGNGWSSPAAKVPAQAVGPLQGTWSIEYGEGGHAMTYSISETGEVKVGKKRRLQLVPAGSAWDAKSDGNYNGCFFLNDAHREDTWEYMWIENDVLQVHHFTTDDAGTSPNGSSNYFGAGVGTRKEEVTA